MLPFLKPKPMGAVIQGKMKDNSPELENEEGEHTPGAMSAAEDMISAVHAKDAKGVADAMKAHHEMMMSGEADNDDMFSMDED